MQFLFRVLFIALFFIPSYAFAQVEIIVSTEKVQDVDGNNFFLHTVQKWETLYGIAMAYKVEVNEIVIYNTDSESGLKIGQTLKIPILAADSSPSQQPQIETREAPTGFVYHQVVKGETLYRIMYNYQVKFEVLQQYNPELTANINIGEWILIPTKAQQKSMIASEKYDSLETYTLKANDNYYRLEKRFKVNQQQLEQLNPQLKIDGLKKGLDIVVPHISDLQEIPQFEAVKIDSIPLVAPVQQTVKYTSGKCGAIDNNAQVYKIGILMPLFSSLNSEIRVESDYLIKNIDEYKSFRFIEFYQGVIIAIDSLQKLGLNAQVYVYDTEASPRKVDSIVKLPSFKALDIVIGPFYAKNVEIVRKAASINHIKVVDLFGTSFIQPDSATEHFAIRSSEAQGYLALAKYISDSLSNYRISIIHGGKTEEVQRLNYLKSALYSLYMHIDTAKISIYSYTDGGMTQLMNSVSGQYTNILFNLVDDEARVSNFLRQLHLKSKDKEIMVMALDKYWKNYTTIELNYLSDLKYTYSTDFYIDYSDSASIIPFEQKFYNEYARIPSELAYIGFDVSWYFASAMLQYGVNFSTCLPHFKIETMLNQYKFSLVRPGVYQNKSTNVIQCDNYQKFIKNK